VTGPTIAERLEHRRHDEAHDCVRPGCGKRARTALHVYAPLRLAGRDWMPGEFVDLCWPHYDELYRAATQAETLGGPLDRLREWADDG
jgi:hypothetical protein